MKQNYISPSLKKISLRSHHLLSTSPTAVGFSTNQSGDTTAEVLSNQRNASDEIWGDE